MISFPFECLCVLVQMVLLDRDLFFESLASRGCRGTLFKVDFGKTGNYNGRMIRFYIYLCRLVVHFMGVQWSINLLFNNLWKEKICRHFR